MKIPVSGHRLGVGNGFIEIFPRLDDCGPEGSHGGVLFRRIALGHNDCRAQALDAGGKGQTLAVIAASGRNQARPFGETCLVAIGIDQTAPHLEGAGRCVIFMLHPDIGAEFGGQNWPIIAGCRGQNLVDEFFCLLKIPDG